jgi:hypothetical protein
MKYEPITREAHLARGTCCGNGCLMCPWYISNRPWVAPTDPRIEEALRSGETVTIYSELMSLVTKVVLQDRVTIIYKPYHRN